MKRIKIFFYSILALFCLASLIAEINHDYRSLKLIKYSFNPEQYFFKDRLYFTERFSGDNSSGSQGNFRYQGIIQSNQKIGNIKGWMDRMNANMKYDKLTNKSYFNIWYCPNLDIIMGLVEGEINSKKNEVYNGNFVQSWFRILLLLLFTPILFKLFLLIKNN